MRVLKFGGTSVGKPARMRHVAQLIDDGVAKIVVLSAVSGTTNKLVAIAEAYLQASALAKNLVNDLEKEYLSFVDELLPSSDYNDQGRKLIEEKFNLLRSFSTSNFSPVEERIILAQGELISTHLFHFYCTSIGLSTELLPALDFMRTNDGEPDMAYIKSRLKQALQQVAVADIYITQGYICKNEHGEIDNLRRGGSDYSASLIGAASEAEEIQIWTDIDGMHNNDPRIVKDTFPIHELSFAEAAELAYFGAKILHPSSVLPAQQANIPVKLLNTLVPDAKGTVISSQITSTSNKVKAVAAKDGITAIKIRSSRMLLAYGFLKKVFEVFEEFRTPIDMIATSEVAVSLTIDDDTHLPKIEEALKEYAHIEVDKDQTIVCVVGEFRHDDAGIAVRVLESLKEIPIRMISSGGSQSNISVLIHTNDKEAALKALNTGLFKSGTI